MNQIKSAIDFTVYSSRRKHVWIKTFDSYQIRLFFLMLYLTITRTCLYNVDPLEPHFYIVKLGFMGVYIIFLFLFKNIDCGYSLEPPRRGGSNEYPQSIFLAEIWKNIRIFIRKFPFLEVKFSNYLNRLVFVMNVDAPCLRSTLNCCCSLQSTRIVQQLFTLPAVITINWKHKTRLDHLQFPPYKIPPNTMLKLWYIF